jgi:hypothetical protein
VILTESKHCAYCPRPPVGYIQWPDMQQPALLCEEHLTFAVQTIYEINMLPEWTGEVIGE